MVSTWVSIASSVVSLICIIVLGIALNRERKAHNETIQSFNEYIRVSDEKEATLIAANEEVVNELDGYKEKISKLPADVQSYINK